MVHIVTQITNSKLFITKWFSINQKSFKYLHSSVNDFEYMIFMIKLIYIKDISYRVLSKSKAKILLLHGNSIKIIICYTL